MKKNIILAIFIAAALVFMVARQKKQKTPILDFAESEAIAWRATWFEGQKKNDIFLEKRKNVWYVVQPFLIKSDQAEALANVKNFLSFDVIKTVAKLDEKKKHCEQPETFSISYHKNKTKKQWTIKVGKKHPSLSAYFVCFDQKVHLVEEWYVLALKKSLDDVIEKDFLGITPLDIKKVTTKNFVISRKKSYFYVEQHEKKTNLKKTDKLIQDLGFLRAKRAVTHHPEKKEILKKAEMVQDFLVETTKNKKISLKIYYWKEKKQAYAKINHIAPKNDLIFDWYEIKMDHLASFSKKKNDFLLQP